TGCAVVISTEDDGDLKMSIGEKHAGQMMYDISGGIGGAVILDKNGEGIFPVKAKSVSVYIPYSKD
ncbi:MAG: DUF1939 domain-containing protein, partial [Chitinophagaceae bacterium]|nr:DUF1939 domain-containing protein [Chitinophagaceae bacterium]